MIKFFDTARTLFGPLRENQVKGLQILLEATEGLPLRHRAYILATAWHETGPASSNLHMTPRKEIWGPTEAQKRYEGRKDLGNTRRGDGKKYMGRGFVQITGRTNYANASDLVNQDLVGNPDLALEPSISAEIIVDGMTVGWFTGKKMADYTSYRDMRRVVNAMDKADLIASYADNFEKALRAAEQPPAPKPPIPNDEPVLRPPASAPEPEVKPEHNLARIVLAALGVAIAAAAAFIFGGN